MQRNGSIELAEVKVLKSLWNNSVHDARIAETPGKCHDPAPRSMVTTVMDRVRVGRLLARGVFIPFCRMRTTGFAE
jgi:hypothetical protein